MIPTDFSTFNFADIDECQNGVHGNCEGPFEEHCTLRPACGYNTKCTNMPGSWNCECLDGYHYIASGDLYDPSIGCIGNLIFII